MRVFTNPFQLAILIILTFTPFDWADKVVLVAGGGEGRDNIEAVKAKIQSPFGVGFDKAGNLYFVEMTGQRVCRIDSRGNLRVLAGTGEKGNGGDDGPASRATFNGPHNLAVAPNGDVYLADTWNNRVRKIDAESNIISSFAGTGEKGFKGDNGPAAKAQFGGIYCVALDPGGHNLYLADLDNRRIRKIDLKSSLVTTVAGNGEAGVPRDGAVAVNAPLIDPRAVAVDSKGTIYILERSGNALRAVDLQGRIRTVAGTGKKGAMGDESDALKATFNGPKHLTVDKDDCVIIADTENHVIRRYNPRDGVIRRLSGSGKKGSAGVGGPSDKVELDQPHGVFIGPDGDLFIADSSNHRILRVERKD